MSSWNRRNKGKDFYISKRLTYLLRHQLDRFPMANDDGSISLGDLINEMSYYEPDDILRVAKTSSGDRGLRFNVQSTHNSGYYIKANYAAKRHQTGENAQVDMLAVLLAFLRDAFEWLYGRVEVPDTMTLQRFLYEWWNEIDMYVDPNVQIRDPVDPHHRKCLNFIHNQIRAIKAQIQNPGEDHHLLVKSVHELAIWEVQKTYEHSWHMHWDQMEALFYPLQTKEWHSY